MSRKDFPDEIKYSISFSNAIYLDIITENQNDSNLISNILFFCNNRSCKLNKTQFFFHRFALISDWAHQSYLAHER